ncbi:Transcriptional regulator [Vibrio sp. B1REV9]|uniref:winged helix-turn-helix domain-containing protein n=1 Tax=Vibrio sp. B1REV9 TaxID=2751179 RepID=UPI001AF9C464|nr:winged helix-turn-helix domain-containing protein [Vibrio sp. B1REV9]CAE6939319.1 Transcriptional regulator [Vibrio sp. B1REV9]
MNLVLHSDHYQFDGFCYSPTEGVIITKDKRIILKARENELLHILIKQHPLPATRDAIQQALWSNSYATDSTINQAIKTLRDDLIDSDRTLIRTIPKTGYILGASPKFVRYQMGAISKQKGTHTQYLPTFIFGLILGLFFLVTGYQFGTPEVIGITANNNQTHYLFEPDNIELARFNSPHSDKEAFIERTELGYRLCEINQGVMLCKNIM